MRIKIKVPKKREASIEKPVVDYARKRGMLVRKMNGLGFAAWPDRMFLWCGETMFIEFKRPGETATEAQLEIHAALRAQGFHVYVVDTVGDGLDYVNDLFKRHT